MLWTTTNNHQWPTSSYPSPEWTTPRFEAFTVLYPHEVFSEHLSIRALELDAPRFGSSRSAALPPLARAAVLEAIHEHTLALAVDQFAGFGFLPRAFAFWSLLWKKMNDVGIIFTCFVFLYSVCITGLVGLYFLLCSYFTPRITG
jgi:hypothetical protein